MLLFQNVQFYLWERSISRVHRKTLLDIIARHGGSMVDNAVPRTNGKQLIVLVKDGAACVGVDFQALREASFPAAPIVPVLWLSDSVLQNRLVNTTSYQESLNLKKRKLSLEDSLKKRKLSLEDSATQSKESKTAIESIASKDSIASNASTESIPEDSIPAESSKSPPKSPSKESPSNIEHWECMRRTPWNHKNPELETMLKHVASLRRARGEKYRAEAYEKAIAAIRALPTRIKGPTDLPAGIIGPSVRTRIDQLFQAVGREKHGLQDYSREAFQELLEATFPFESEMERAVIELSRIHGLGTARAKTLFQKFGISGTRQLVEAVNNGLPSSLPKDTVIVLANWERLEERISLHQACQFLSELEASVRASLPQDGAESWMALMPVGGYRRGKPDFHDLDILVVADITYYHGFTTSPAFLEYPSDRPGPVLIPIPSSINQSPIRFILDACRKSNLFFASLSGGRHSTGIQDDHAEIGSSQLTLMKARRDSDRLLRIDFIHASHAHGSFPYMLLGWTGSRRFEQSIRLYASRTRGLSLSNSGFSSGSTVVKDGKITQEKDIFSFLDLEYICPQDRNC